MSCEVQKLYELVDFEKAMGVSPPTVLYPFTEEKQLKLIKWLGTNHIIEINQITIRSELKWLIQIERYNFSYHEDFSEALAGLIVKLWNDLTESEKTEVKEILS